MKDEFKNLDLVHNSNSQRFEMEFEKHKAIIEYSNGQDFLIFSHTEVPPQLEGRGVASAIIEKALEYVDQHNIKILPLCPVVSAFIKKHPEWQKVVRPWPKQPTEATV